MTGRDRLVVAVLALVALCVGGWFLLLSPQHDEASGLGNQIATLRQQRASALADIAAGLQARHSYAHDYATVARLGAAVPDDDSVASLLVQIQQSASASRIDFRSLKIGQASAASVAPPSVPVAGGATTTQASAATLPPGAAVGTAGFPTMPFSFQFAGSFFHLSNFIGRLQHYLVVRNRSLAVSGRFMTLDGIGLSAAPQGFPRIEASVAATTYLVPTSEGLTNGASASGPAGAATSAATTGGTGTPAAPATATPPAP
jgi:hypothetical protein